MRTPSQNVPMRPGFTLVELLVVITIIGILASLIAGAAVNALRSAGQARIKLEMSNFAQAIEDYKNNSGGSYPPSTVIDDAGPIVESEVYNALRRHLSKKFPRHREPDALIRGLCGLKPTGALTAAAVSDQPDSLLGGMTAAEALVFWMGGFSDDPLYPISGEGGPSYSLKGVAVADEARVDPIDNRPWSIEVKPERLAPRDAENYFDSTDSRFVEYDDPQDTTERRRINFWVYLPPNSKQPLVYFDAPELSGLTDATDPPAAGPAVSFTGKQAQEWAGLTQVYALKRANPSATIPANVFANAGKFQLLHCGIDERWGVLPGVNNAGVATKVYPDGPFTSNEFLADTLTSFTDGTLEDTQP